MEHYYYVIFFGKNYKRLQRKEFERNEHFQKECNSVALFSLKGVSDTKPHFFGAL